MSQTPSHAPGDRLSRLTLALLLAAIPVLAAAGAPALAGPPSPTAAGRGPGPGQDGGGSDGSGPTGETLWIEARAPMAFGEGAEGDGADRTAGETLALHRARYRVDARVLLPLLLLKVPLVKREGVGFSSFTIRDYAGPAGSRMRALEYLAASFPDRARGLNRMGFLREAMPVAPDAEPWSAYFGVISDKREETLDDAKAALEEDPDGQVLAIIDGIVDAGGSRNTVSHVRLGGRWTDAGELFDEVRRRLRDRSHSYRRRLENRPEGSSGRAYEDPVAFLAGLQASLRQVAASLANDEDPEGIRQRYVHNGRPLIFEVTGVDGDGDRGRRHAEAGWVRDPDAVRRIEYRIEETDDEEVEEFKLWVEMPPSVADPERVFLPLEYEFEPRSFLRLRAVRVE